MKCSEETDYRTAAPQAAYELKKVALRLRRKGKEVKEICEITGLVGKTVRMAINAYDAGGIDAIKPQKRGRRAGEKRTLSVEQEQEIIAMLVDHDPAQFKLKGCMWTRGSVKELIQQRYGITMPNRTVGDASQSDYIYLDPPYIGKDTSYVGAWPREEAISLAHYSHRTSANVCLSMWKENDFRRNNHLYEYWSDFIWYEQDHFYYVGAKEDNRHPIVEVLAIKR